MVTLLSSKAFVDYTSSGLENPLSFLILALFYYYYFTKDFNVKTFTTVCLISALAAFNRMDTIIFYVFPLMYFGYQTHKKNKASFNTILKKAVLGFTPFITWLLFSLIYYGFIFPNTAYAKLHTGIESKSFRHFSNINFFLRVTPLSVV